MDVSKGTGTRKLVVEPSKSNDAVELVPLPSEQEGTPAILSLNGDSNEDSVIFRIPNQNSQDDEPKKKR